MKIFFIYAKIPQKVYDKRLKYIISNQYDFEYKDGYMVGLYAWTKKKKICKEFFELRDGIGNLYTIMEKDVNHSQYEYIREKYFELELLPHKYFYVTHINDVKEDMSMNDRFMEVVSTKNEYKVSTNESSEYIHDFGPKVEENYPNPRIFNSKTIEILDIIGYTTEYDILFGTKEQSQYALDQFQDGKTVYGHDIFLTGENELTNLLYLFKFMFFGSDDKEIQGEV